MKPPSQAHLKCGDVYVVVRSFSTLAFKEYLPGDTLTLIEPTGQSPFGIIAEDNVNWVVKCPHFCPPMAQSVWSCFQYLIIIGNLKKG